MTTPLSGKPTFGAGRVFMTGNYANPTPIRPLVVQSQAVEFKQKLESLFGEKALAAAVGKGEMEVTGKVEYGKTNPRVLNDLMFGQGTSTGNYQQSDNEAHTVPAVSTYTVTATNYTTGIFIDLGVKNVTTGAAYSCVASGSEVAGTSYSVNLATGVYKFAAGDANVNVAISYACAVAAAGETVNLNNFLQGGVNSFQAVHVLPWQLPTGVVEQDMFVFYNCFAGSTGLSAKKSGFGMTTLDYTAAVNGNDQLGVATFAEAA